MVYVSSIEFPTRETETDFFLDMKRTCYDSFYPFGILSRRQFHRIDFEPVTILYGGNGTGKSTALNVIGEKAGVKRDAIFNKSNFFQTYIQMCHIRLEQSVPEQSRIISSDDVFDYMLNIRTLNEGIDKKRDQLFEECLDAKYSSFQLHSMADYDELKRINLARRSTQSRYVRKRLMDNIREYSNGESAFDYFTEKLGEDGLFLLDEPENSLSAQRQMELMAFLQDAVRYFGCQLVIATHSPFLLAFPGAKIYDLDEKPVDVKPWTQLENVRLYYDFFQRHRDEFEENGLHR